MKSSYIDLRIKNIRSQCVNGVYNGDIDISHANLTKLPDLSDITVTGYFNCSGNRLKSLKGCPKSVEGYFIIYGNQFQLKSLDDGPRDIGKALCMYKEEWDKLDSENSLYVYLLLSNKVHLPKLSDCGFV